MSAVECVGVEKSFGGVPALRSTDLSLAERSLTAVLGPSGCGKTTLLRVIAGFERLDGGTVTVSGRAVAGPGLHLPPERRRVTIVPQEQALFPHLTVAENVGYGVGSRRSGRAGWSRRSGHEDRQRAGDAGRRGADRAKAVDAMLEMAGLSGLGGRMPHELSGGQQQRVALARALAPGPSVVLLDEPFGSLDAALRAELRADVAALLHQTSATALLVTHDQEEALSMADSVAVMRDGRIVQHGSPADVYRRPADLWVAGFVGSANVLPGTITAPGRVETSLGTLDVARAPATEAATPAAPAAATAATTDAAAGAVDVVVRPEQVRVSTDGGVAGVIEDRRYFGHDSLVRIALDRGERVMARLPSDDSTRAGARVQVVCREPVLCFPRGR